MTFGILVGAILLGILLFMCCKTCCGGCCGFQEKSETQKAKRAEARRVQQDGAAGLPDVDAIKASVVRGVMSKGPVRPAGMWATGLPRRASRPASRGSDEIRAVTVVEEQRADEQKIEEQKVEQRRLEIARAEESELPADEVPPPKYTP